MSKPLYLGVDGGASGTRALLVEGDGQVRGLGHGGSGNHQGIGYPAAIDHIHAAVHEACAEAGVEPESIAFAHFAMAGDDVEIDQIHLTHGLQATFPGLRFALTNDVWAGLRAGAVEGYGVAVNCGSGCGAVGRDAGGNSVIIPDLGYEFGDSGGGMQIARDAVRAVVRAWDGRGPATALTPVVLAVFGEPDVDSLYVSLYQERHPYWSYRKLTRLVFVEARGGDPVALGILTRIGEELGVAGGAVARRLALGEAQFPFVLTGGTFRTLDSPLAEAAIRRMRQDALGITAVLPLVMPVAGAALLALDGARLPVSPEHYGVLRSLGQGWHPEERYGVVKE
ncbi:MAG TPA: BadF/BadG/BcrA/BcrD ATPase family protein [Chloroflexota bacterium]|nr:BadF/BadG/BcrA/BcrD ATPase family protein [Chloroflexota bacterium]